MKLYKDALKDYSKRALGYAPLAIIVQTALGSVAVMLIQMKGDSMFQLVQLGLITIFCFGYNVTILTHQKPYLSFNALVMSLVMSLLLIGINIV